MDCSQKIYINMEKEFVQYQEALELKELGFNEPCFGYYYTLNGKDWKFAEKNEYYKLDNEINIGSKFSLLAPTFSQAFRWFREKYEYNSFIRGRKSMGFDYTLSDVPTNLSKKDIFQSPHVYKTYEQAELACLIKLIEIVKNEK